MLTIIGVSLLRKPLMPAFDLSLSLALIGAVFVLAGFVKGVVGLGLPTITMGLLSITMPPSQAAALLVVPSLVTNVWQMVGRPGLWLLTRRMATMMAGVCTGVWAGAGWLTGSGSGAATAALGAALVVYAALGLLAVHFHVPPRHESWMSPLVGAVTGLVTAATGVFVIPAVPYLHALGMEKEELVQALGVSFLVSTIALAASLGSAGALQPSTAWGSLLALLPALLGMGFGQWLRLRVRPELFKRLFFIGLLLLGIYLVARTAPDVL